MAKDWASDVKKFVPDADDGVIAGIVRYCGIALQKPDSSLVSYGDPVELGRVRNNFLKKKCALTDSDDVLDAAIARVGKRMKGVNFKNRVTVYYLLLDDLNLLHLFRKTVPMKKGAAAVPAAVDASPKAAPVAAVAAAAVGAVATAGADTAASGVRAGTEAAVDRVAPVLGIAAAGATALGTTGATATMAGSETGGARAISRDPRYGAEAKAGPGGFLMMAAIGLIGLAAIIGLFLILKPFARKDVATAAATTDTGTATVAPGAGVAPSTGGNTTAAVAPVAAPAGAGVVSEMRDAKPVVKVYFDTGKSVVAPAFALATDPVKAYLAANAGSVAAISGFNDPTGNAAANAALSKKRAQAVQASLVAAGVPAASIELVKPSASTDTTTTAAEARRVEVYIK